MGRRSLRLEHWERVKGFLKYGNLGRLLKDG